MTITREELHAALGTVTVLDTLGGGYYAQQHCRAPRCCPTERVCHGESS
jgi:hypothetical protein